MLKQMELCIEISTHSFKSHPSKMEMENRVVVVDAAR